MRCQCCDYLFTHLSSYFGASIFSLTILYLLIILLRDLGWLRVRYNYYRCIHTGWGEGVIVTPSFVNIGNVMVIIVFIIIKVVIEAV